MGDYGMRVDTGEASQVRVSKGTVMLLSRWMTSHRLNGIMRRMKEAAQSTKEVPSNLQVDSYWDSNDEAEKSEAASRRKALLESEVAMKAVLTLQSSIRLWLAIRMHMRKNKTRLPGVTSIQVVQASVRRYAAQNKYLALMKSRRRIVLEFKTFIDMLREKRTSREPPIVGKPYPFKLYMYSRHKGSKDLRPLYIDDKTHSKLCWRVNSVTQKSVDLRKIYAVEKGSSGAFYTAVPDNKSLCFHVLAVGDVKYDFELKDGDGAAQLYQFVINNFKRLVALYNGPCSFYLDIEGVPRRSGPSVVEYAITEKPDQGFRSEADENRYRIALSSLRAEYEGWRVDFLTEKRNLKMKNQWGDLHTSTKDDGKDDADDDDDDDDDDENEYEEEKNSEGVGMNLLQKGLVDAGLVGSMSFFEKESGDIDSELRKPELGTGRYLADVVSNGGILPFAGLQTDSSSASANERKKTFWSFFRGSRTSTAAPSNTINDIPHNASDHVLVPTIIPAAARTSTAAPSNTINDIPDNASDHVLVPTIIPTAAHTSASSDSNIPDSTSDRVNNFWSFFGAAPNVAPSNQNNPDNVSEPLSVIEHDIDGVVYYVTNAIDGDIYMKEGNDEVGNPVGKMVDGKATFSMRNGPTTSSPATELFTNLFGGIFGGFGAAQSNAEEIKEEPVTEPACESDKTKLIEIEFEGNKYFILDELNSPIFSIDKNGIVDKQVGEIKDGIPCFTKLSELKKNEKTKNKKPKSWFFGGGKQKPGQSK